MKKVAVLKRTEVEVKPFMLDDFIYIHPSIMPVKKVTKKELKLLADDMNLNYSDTDITLSKKLLNAYLAKR